MDTGGSDAALFFEARAGDFPPHVPNPSTLI